MSADSGSEARLARALIDAGEAYERDGTVESGLALVRARHRLERAVQLPCGWVARCRRGAGFEVWSNAPGGHVERRVCPEHLAVALAIGFTQGRPPQISPDGGAGPPSGE